VWQQGRTTRTGMDTRGRSRYGDRIDAAHRPSRPSAYRLVAWGTIPLGAAAAGLLAQALGLRAVFVIMALLTLASVGMTNVTNKSMAEVERNAERLRA
jgi:uncharacterized membrane protein YoaK (UPF0700 family)